MQPFLYGTDVLFIQNTISPNCTANYQEVDFGVAYILATHVNITAGMFLVLLIC